MATRAHSGQVRKMGSIPYVIHPFEVAAIAASIDAEEDVMIACLLHDVIECADVTVQELTEQFGKRVADLVAGDTEFAYAAGQAEATWQARKQETLDRLKASTDIGVKTIWLCDKLSNMRSFYRAWRKQGDAFLNALHQKDKKVQKWYYDTVVENLTEFTGTAAYDELRFLIDRVFGGEEA